MTDTCKSYTRIENCGNYTRITDVDSEGRYCQRCVGPYGCSTGEHRTTLQAMGWPSLAEFLRCHKGFVLTGC